MDIQAIDVVTFDFKGTHVRCFFKSSTDNTNEFLLGANRFYIINVCKVQI